jgi:hypothetical protein
VARSVKYRNARQISRNYVLNAARSGLRGRNEKSPPCDGAEGKREGATGSLAIVASDRGPSHPRSIFRDLPAMSRGEPQANAGDQHWSGRDQCIGAPSPVCPWPFATGRHSA